MSRNYYQQRQVVKEKPSYQTDDFISPLPCDATVTMAYVPFQTDAAMYDDMKALCEGTLFPVLNKPFLGAGDRR